MEGKDRMWNGSKREKVFDTHTHIVNGRELHCIVCIRVGCIFEQLAFHQKCYGKYDCISNHDNKCASLFRARIPLLSRFPVLPSTNTFTLLTMQVLN